MAVKISRLNKSFSDLKVIDNLNLELSYGNIHCLFGPSGCGKTTLLNILAGLLDADSGQVEGCEKGKISYIFQEDRLLPWSTVKENIMFVLKSDYTKEKAQNLVEKYLNLVNLLDFKDHYPDQLSGGMKQRVAIARAFSYQGDIILMDEPFKGLDFDLKRDLMDYIINYWQRKNQTLVFVTHDIEETLYMADYVYTFTGPSLNIINQFKIDLAHNKRIIESESMNYYKNLLTKKDDMFIKEID
ncbi:ABC transporter ATP-binding protein [Natranaerobius trueperi]|uniref:ABC transporter n=1 Tax=Natranaerobius trueperi TaxID=759412 RepID=A0A226C0X0_9FIRM|nr:ABC transporter ATP-binding protein [Natranaerobius trueperi]OWZ84835.1 ABC transporter [Natranaerobius trueperi]